MQAVYLHPLWPADAEKEKPDASIALTRFPFVIGRHPDCDHRLPDPWISRRHCSFFLQDGQVRLVDLGSRNGTYLNGQPILTSQPVHEGDRVDLGYLPFQVRLAGLPGAVPAGAEPDPRAAACDGQSHNVLVVEDDVEAAQALAAQLKSWGHEVHVAYDGPEALQAARQHHPDTVLLDLRLPRMDGYQVAKRLRRQEGLDKAFVVALTGSDPAGGRPQEVGIDQVLTKPVDLEALQEVLSQS
jgi:CheY-like chemotaxis protein